MKPYDKTFKEEAVKLSDDIGTKRASEQLGVPYHTLSGWRKNRKLYGDNAYSGSGHKRSDANLTAEDELRRENAELRRANEILQEALCFFVDRRKK